MNSFLKQQSGISNPMTVEEVAMGFIRVANESMCRPIRALTQVNYILWLYIRDIYFQGFIF